MRATRFTAVVPEPEAPEVAHQPSLEGESEMSSMYGRSTDALAFQVLPVWRGESGKHSVARPKKRKGLTHCGGTQQLNMYVDEFVELDEADSGEMRCKTIHPNAGVRTVWDIAFFILICYDVVALPLQFLDMESNYFTVVTAWITRFFWTCDIPATFLTGLLQDDGSIKMRHAAIARVYLRSWFCFDFLLVCTDWVEVFMLSNGFGTLDFVRLGRVSRSLRVIRMFRLLRVVKLKSKVNAFIEKIHSESLLVALDIVQIVLVMVASAHTIACVWCGLGGNVGGHHRTWITANGFQVAPVGMLYTLSLHWSWAQFTGGMDEITPQNLLERVFAIATLFVAFLMATIFVSSLTSSMTKLNMLASRKAHQFKILRQYLNENKISSALSCRLCRNAQHAVQTQVNNICEENVEVLSMITVPLLMELHFEIHSKIFRAHPFFEFCCDQSVHSMRAVSHAATSMLFFSVGDVIFDQGEMPSTPMMYFVVDGTLQYISMYGNKRTLLPRMWISEAFLWTEWIHRGTLQAESHCQLCGLDAKRYQDIMSEFDHHNSDIEAYAEKFVRYLSSEPLVNVTDISCPLFGRGKDSILEFIR